MGTGATSRKRFLTGQELVTGLLILAALIAAWHVLPALAAKDTPPAACQLFGGEWNLWNGWNCG
jgi:hypothetical protein